MLHGFWLGANHKWLVTYWIWILKMWVREKFVKKKDDIELIMETNNDETIHKHSGDLCSKLESKYLHHLTMFEYMRQNQKTV